MTDDSGSESLPVPALGRDLVPQGPQPLVNQLANADVTRLSALLNDSDRLQAIGQSILKALITDVLRTKLGLTTHSVPHWQRIETWTRVTTWERVAETFVPTETNRVIAGLLAQVSLSAEELQVIEQLDLGLLD